jgi:hypothetical protein
MTIFIYTCSKDAVDLETQTLNNFDFGHKYDLSTLEHYQWKTVELLLN